MAVSKVIYGNTTVIDITDSTVTASKLKSGEYAYGADGTKITGTLVVPEELDDLSDVVITSPETAQELYYDGTNWINYGAKILLTFDDDFRGQTITLTKGQTTITKTAPLDSNTMNLYVNDTGLWTISSTISGYTYETEVNITTFGTSFTAELSSIPPVPEGATVTPTDDIQTWLACANITDKAYTTLAEVLADEETYETLLRDSNACDYMARSTSWALAVGTVPVMTSNTTPYGECIGSGDGYSSTYSKWMAFNPSEMRGWLNDSTQPYIHVGNYVGYTYTSAIKNILCDIQLLFYSSANTVVGKFQGSNDGTNWNDLTGTISVTSNANNIPTRVVFTSNLDSYISYRWVCTTVPTNNYTYGIRLQFYANADITTNETAMRYLGKYDYACDKLLSNQTWAEAITNSSYFEYVLNVKVPTMTSNTTPSGVASASNSATGYEPYKAFDNNTSTSWSTNNNYGSGSYLRYQFTNSVLIKAFSITTRYLSANMLKSYKIQGSNDASTWVDLYEETLENRDYGKFTRVLNNNSDSYSYYQLLATSDSYYSNKNISVLELQFYGRKPASSSPVIHSAPLDTIYYMDNGSPVVVCTTNSDGVGEFDLDDLEDATYTFYSSVAKDPSNLSNDFSKSIRITKSQWGGTTELYLMPNGEVIYWYGYKGRFILDDSDLQSRVTYSWRSGASNASISLSINTYNLEYKLWQPYASADAHTSQYEITGSLNLSNFSHAKSIVSLTNSNNAREIIPTGSYTSPCNINWSTTPSYTAYDSTLVDNIFDVDISSVNSGVVDYMHYTPGTRNLYCYLTLSASWLE